MQIDGSPWTRRGGLKPVGPVYPCYPVPICGRAPLPGGQPAPKPTPIRTKPVPADRPTVDAYFWRKNGELC